MEDSVNSLRRDALSRRRVLAAGGVTLVTALSGCSSGSEDEADPDTAESPAGSSPTAESTPQTDTPTEDTATDTPPPETPLSEVSGIPMEGYTPARRYYNPEEFGPTGSLTQRWRRQPNQAGTLTKPTVVDGMIYTAVEGETRLYALNSGDGSVNWKFTPPSEDAREGTKPAVSGAPAVAGDTVVIGSNTGRLYGLQRSDGTIKWRFNASSSARRWTAPAVAGETVYATATGQDNTGWVYAVAAQTGEKQWEEELGPVGSPAVGNSALCVTEFSGPKLYCLDPTSGATRWKKQGIGTQYRPPTIAHETVYARQIDGGSAVALSASDGSRRWRKMQEESSFMLCAAVADELALLAGENRMVAVAPTTGEALWRTKFPSYNAVVVNNAVYAGFEEAESGGVRVLSPNDGGTMTKLDGLATDPDGIAVVDGYIFVVGGNLLWALEPA